MSSFVPSSRLCASLGVFAAGSLGVCTVRRVHGGVCAQLAARALRIIQSHSPRSPHVAAGALLPTAACRWCVASIAAPRQRPWRLWPRGWFGGQGPLHGGWWASRFTSVSARAACVRPPASAVVVYPRSPGRVTSGVAEPSWAITRRRAQPWSPLTPGCAVRSSLAPVSSGPQQRSGSLCSSIRALVCFCSAQRRRLQGQQAQCAGAVCCGCWCATVSVCGSRPSPWAVARRVTSLRWFALWALCERALAAQ